MWRAEIVVLFKIDYIWYKPVYFIHANTKACRQSISLDQGDQSESFHTSRQQSTKSEFNWESCGKCSGDVVTQREMGQRIGLLLCRTPSHARKDGIIQQRSSWQVV